MEEEQKVIEEAPAEKPKRKGRPVAVRIVARKGESVLVEWNVGDDLARAFIPAAEAVAEIVSPEVLAQGIPYGVPWQELIDLSRATPENFGREMRKHGLWTAEDIEAKPKDVQRVLHAVTGITSGALHGIARKHQKGG